MKISTSRLTSLSAAALSLMAALSVLGASPYALAAETAPPPSDLEQLMAQADALVQEKRPGDAILIYRQVAVKTHSHELVEKLANAEAQRQVFLGACLSKNGEAGVQACQSARLAGAPDEITIDRRRGALFQGQNQTARALDAYIAAERKKPNDRAVALAVVTLSNATGRKDAATLAARGSALLTLGRPAEAIRPLREALRLEPGLADTHAELSRAIAQARLTGPREPDKAAALQPETHFSNASPPTRTN